MRQRSSRLTCAHHGGVDGWHATSDIANARERRRQLQRHLVTESLVFPVALDAPEEVQVAGRRWFRRPEFHVTTFDPGDLAAATGVGSEKLVEIAEPLRGELTMARPIRFDGRVSAVVDPDGRRTLVAFCHVDGLEDTYVRLSALAGCTLPRPPTHVTLYTAEPDMEGIGLSTQADVDAKTAALPPADAHNVLAGLRLGAMVVLDDGR